MTRLRINYGINRRVPVRDSSYIAHANGKMAIVGQWEDDSTHDKIRSIIKRRHPGWAITGWAKAK